MSEKPFDPRAIPYREHYDRLMTVATTFLSRSAQRTADIQALLGQDARHKIMHPPANGDDFARVQAVLAEIGFCAVIDHMAEIIELEEGGAKP
jgi:hypothetical protein